MTDYKEMYFLLFNKITKTIENLQEIQRQAEEMYIAQDKIYMTQEKQSSLPKEQM